MSDWYRSVLFFFVFFVSYLIFSPPVISVIWEGGKKRKNGTCLFMRVILQAARASVFHVNHSRVNRDGVLHQPLHQERVNCVQGR